MLLHLFQPKQKTKPVTFSPRCAECEKYRNLISSANGAGDKLFTDQLRKDFAAHVRKEHGTNA